MRKALIPAFLLLLGSTILGATVLREPLAHAAAPIASVFVTNDASSPVPVREQNLDANGNVKVHEVGSVSVRPVVPANPWHRAFSVAANGTEYLFDEPSSSAINITSLTVSQTGTLDQAAAGGLLLETVPDTATTCAGASRGDTLWHSATFAAPLAVSFPTPLVASAPAGRKVCIRAYAAGPAGDPFVNFSMSGFFGSQ
jgi:hypothetical protein